VVAAALIAASIVATNLYWLDIAPQGHAYRLNSLTGDVSLCAGSTGCFATDEKAPQK